MSVVEYAENFKDIDAYYNQDIYTPDEHWKINKFMFGLRGEIEHSVAQQHLSTYHEMLR